MPSKNAKNFGSNGLFYDYEWTRDTVDQHVDNLLLARFGRVPRCPDKPRAALDIGCSTGYRAKFIAKTGIFDTIFAADIGDRTEHIIAINNILRRESCGTSIHFIEKNVVELAPALFDSMQVDFVSFRNVAHFLSPNDFRTALVNIRDIAAKDALVCLSFDGVTKNDFDDFLPITSEMDDVDFYTNHASKQERVAPYSRYGVESVESFINELGFVISTDAVDNTSGGVRNGEYHVIAAAPGPETETPILAAMRPRLFKREFAPA